MQSTIVEARIEIPMGSQNKYEIDHKTGKIKLDLWGLGYLFRSAGRKDDSKYRQKQRNDDSSNVFSHFKI